MRNGFLISMLSLAFTAGIAIAQDDPLPKKQSDDRPQAKSPPLVEVPTQKTPADQSVESGPAPKTRLDLNGAPLMSDSCWSDCGGCGDCGCGNKCWGSIEYLTWWIKSASLPPLVTTGNPAVDGTLTGAIGESTTKILYGGNTVDFGTFSGMRLTLGGWVNSCQSFGIEANAFLLEERSQRFAAGSDANGNPPLYIPALFNNGIKQLEDRLVVSQPGSGGSPTLAGNVVIASTSRLWGSEVNGVFGHWTSCNWEGRCLVGLRYVDLLETFDLANTTSAIPTTENSTSSFVATLADHFQTRNQFYGAQIGTTVSYWWDCLSVDMTGKLAVGDTHELVNIIGISSISGPNTPIPAGKYEGGLFAQPTNIGSQTRNEFTVIPEFLIKLNCDILPGLRASIGYDVMYWNDVVRPGNQIDRNLNLTQSPVISQSLGGLVGAPFPASQFNRESFFAQGVTFGLELRY